LSPTNERAERGFTLVEVLIAMVILTIALVSMAELMAITLRMQMMGRNETAAIRLVQSKIDELVALNFNLNATVNVGGSLTGDVGGYNDDPDPGFHRRWQIAAIAGETGVRLLTVRIIPTVNDRRTNAQIELTTIIRSIAPVP
jgi:prepilin-type N-terminal cleavage/methylation domain-containing protein